MSLLQHYSSLLYTSPFPFCPVFDVEPEDVLAAVGASVRFDCTFTTSSPSASLSWLRDGAVLTSDSRHTYHSNGTLQISPVAAEDEGEYTCRVTDTVTQEVEERSASLTLAGKRILTDILQS